MRIGDWSSDVCSSDLLDRLEHLVHRSEAAPEDHPGGLDLFRRVAAERLGEIPDNHLVQANTHVLRGVAAEMLVREEQHFLATRERPFQHGTRIARRADDATMTAAE